MVVTTVAPQDVPTRKAYFASNPKNLDDAFRVVCSEHGIKFTQTDRYTTRCDHLPTPEGAAFLLIHFDGALELPRVAVEKTTRPSGEGFEVEIRYFAEILNKSGKKQRIYLPHRRLDRQFDRILQITGGTPVKQ